MVLINMPHRWNLRKTHHVRRVYDLFEKKKVSSVIAVNVFKSRVLFRLVTDKTAVDRHAFVDSEEKPNETDVKSF